MDRPAIPDGLFYAYCTLSPHLFSRASPSASLWRPKEDGKAGSGRNTYTMMLKEPSELILHLNRPIFAKKCNMDQPIEQPNQLNIEISEEVAEGTYANLAIITHSHAEFVIDFVNVMPGTPKSKVKSRIILTPQHAKRFMKAITDNIQKYESVNGPIKDLEEIQLPMNFGGPTAQA